MLSSNIYASNFNTALEIDNSNQDKSKIVLVLKLTEVNFENIISSYIPMPVCMINSNGKITSANDKIGEVFIYDAIIDADIFALTGVKTADLFEAAKDSTRHIIIRRNDRIFKLICHNIPNL